MEVKVVIRIFWEVKVGVSFCLKFHGGVGKKFDKNPVRSGFIAIEE